MNELADQLLAHIKAAWRYRWSAILVAWLGASIGWAIVHLLPDLYTARARVQVDTQTVLRPLLTGLAVQPNIDQIVRMMSRTLISWENLEKVVEMAGMDANLTAGETKEQLIHRLGKNISIQSSNKENVYTLSFLGRNPQEAKLVVSTLLTFFEKESLSDKRRDSDAARRFIDEQLESYGKKLKAAERAVMEFKRENVGLLPGEGQSYYAQLRSAEEALRQARLDLREAENSRNAIQQQLDSYRKMNPVQEDKIGTGIDSALDARINGLEKQLDSLRVTYTDQHPDVIALVRLISHLKQERAEKAKLGTTGPSTQRVPDLGSQQLLVSLSSAEANVAALRARVATLDRRYSELKSVANALPRVEAEFTQLTRDYGIIRARYNQLLERRESAQISGEMEANTNVIGFRVVEPVRLPNRPSWPNRPQLISLVFLGALAAGVGLAFLISQLRPTFNDERRLAEVSGFPVLGTIVMGWTKQQIARRRRGRFALVFSFLALVSVYGVIMASVVLAGAGA